MMLPRGWEGKAAIQAAAAAARQLCCWPLAKCTAHACQVSSALGAQGLAVLCSQQSGAQHRQLAEDLMCTAQIACGSC